MGTIAVAAVVFGALGYTVFRMILFKRKGGACIGCPANGNCAACSKKTVR